MTANDLANDLANNEIIKALECCGDKNCKYCPNFSEDIECSEKLIKLSLDLIKRQEAKIERLKKELHSCVREVSRSHKIDRNKGIIAFATKMKEKSVWDDKGDTKIVYEYDIDSLVAELTESEEEE